MMYIVHTKKCTNLRKEKKKSQGISIILKSIKEQKLFKKCKNINRVKERRKKKQGGGERRKERGKIFQTLLNVVQKPNKNPIYFSNHHIFIFLCLPFFYIFLFLYNLRNAFRGFCNCMMHQNLLSHSPHTQYLCLLVRNKRKK
ncbi:hypothetical protein ACKWTF_003511 [Chironomus riparius]